MAVVWAIEQMDEPPPGLAVAFTVGEEGLGDLRGARAACAALEPHAVIALEGHGLDEVMIDHVGSVRARVAVTGPGGHSWWDRETPSAVHALVGIASDLVATRANVGDDFRGRLGQRHRRPGGAAGGAAFAGRARAGRVRRAARPASGRSAAAARAASRWAGDRPAERRPIIPWSPPCAGCESASVCPIGWVPDRPMPTPRWRRAFPRSHWAVRVARACIHATSGSICARSSSAAFRWSKSCASWPADGSPRPRPAGSAAHPLSHPASSTGR